MVDQKATFRLTVCLVVRLRAGPQALIFGQYDDGWQVNRGINLNISGTNNLVDVLDYLDFNSRKGIALLEPILGIVKDFAVANGLSGSDVLISGYSARRRRFTNMIAAEQ